MVTDRRKKAQLVIGLAFLLGAITGGLSAYLLYSQKTQLNNNVVDVANELSFKVGLDEAQYQKAIELLTESRKQRNDIYKQIQPQLALVRDSTRAKIRPILNTEQSRKYDLWIQELDAKRAQKTQEEHTK